MGEEPREGCHQQWAYWSSPSGNGKSRQEVSCGHLLGRWDLFDVSVGIRVRLAEHRMFVSADHGLAPGPRDVTVDWGRTWPEPMV